MTFTHKSRHSKLFTAAGLIGALATALIMPAFVQATPAPAPEDRYIVVLSDSVRDVPAVANDHARAQKLSVSRTYTSALKGYATKLTAGKANALKSDKRVAYIEKDSRATTQAIQSGATWGLDRIDQSRLPLSTTYNYTNTGTGVKAYIIDTGIRNTHTDFGARVVSGFDAYAGKLASPDCNGHGTHVAGTVGGSTYGVAKNVTLVSVRVLDCNGSGWWSDVIAGIDYVTANHLAGQPAVANMSLGGGAMTSVDTAVQNSINDGITYAVAAGNSSQDACRYSPARVSAALTTGATTSYDARSSFSNTGSCIDWFAPGSSIKSAYHTSTTATAVLSGTSMASPHTAGVAALYLQSNPSATPATVRSALYAQTTKSVVTKARSVNNHLLFTNY
jgi:subtilisin family serine protease